MTLRNFFKSLAPLAAIALSATTFAAGKSEHVLLVVWDGMRPDFVTPAYAPTLYNLAREGVFFANHHPLYISSTEVNGTGLATGVQPNRSGVLANSEYRPEIGWLGPNATEGLEMMRRGDLLSGGNFIRVPTVAEILQANGMETAIIGTKPVAAMHDRRSVSARSGASRNSPVVFNGMSIPTSLVSEVERVNDNKKFPTNSTPNSGRDEWTTKGLTQVLWKKGVPKYSVLWLSEPDASQHANSPGSDNAIGAIESSDKRLGSVLRALDEKKVRDKTDILIVSDHGFSTISRGFDLTEMMKRGGFRATKKFEDAEPGDVMIVPLGGSALIYVIDHDPKVIDRAVEFLQSTDVVGVIFSQREIKGTFPLSAARLDAAKTAPDLIVSFRWTDERNEFGAPGTVYAEGGKRGSGTHASLSRFDMHNTLIAHGPSFKRGLANSLPSSNADVAPTILSILNVKPTTPMDGRVLTEAFVNGSAPSGEPKMQTLEAEREIGFRKWRQYLKTVTYGGAFYVIEGNGASEVK
jgi:predicted AlkP superfamily pyrophosphatase or phosphodiesterase